MANTCVLKPRFWIIMRCDGQCPPGAGDRCTLQSRPRAPPGAPPDPWKTVPSGWRLRRPNEDYRCECLRPGG